MSQSVICTHVVATFSPWWRRRGWVSPHPYPWWAGSWRSRPCPPCTGSRSYSGQDSQTSPQHPHSHHDSQQMMCYLVLFTLCKLSSNWKLHTWFSNFSRFKFLLISVFILNLTDLKSTLTLLQDSTQDCAHNTWSKLLGSESTEVKMVLKTNVTNLILNPKAYPSSPLTATK